MDGGLSGGDRLVVCGVPKLRVAEAKTVAILLAVDELFKVLMLLIGGN